MGISENQRPFGAADRTRFPSYLRNQLRYWKKDATNGFSASNRSDNHLEGVSDCSWKAPFTGGKVVMDSHVYNYSDATRADTEKWRAPVESPHQIGITTIWSDVLTAVGGAWAGDQKNADSE